MVRMGTENVRSLPYWRSTAFANASGCKLPTLRCSHDSAL